MSKARRSVIICIFGGLFFLAGSIVLFFVNPVEKSLFPPCPFHYITGLYCPGCGSLRGLHQLLHGNIIGALEYNPLMVVSLPFVAYGLFVQGVKILTGRQLPTVFIKAHWIWALFVLIILYTIARNLPWLPFNWLAPG